MKDFLKEPRKRKDEEDQETWAPRAPWDLPEKYRTSDDDLPASATSFEKFGTKGGRIPFVPTRARYLRGEKPPADPKTLLIQPKERKLLNAETKGKSVIRVKNHKVTPQCGQKP